LKLTNKTKGIVAGVAGAAILLAGGGTFALWSASATVDGGTITAGNLDVAAVGDIAWQDVSAGAEAAPRAIDLDTFRITPGDTITGTQGVAIALDGDNLKAAVTVSPGTVDGSLLSAADGVTLSYSVLDGSGEVLASDVDLGTPSVVDVYADNYAGTVPGVNAIVSSQKTLPSTPTDADLQVVIKASFDQDTPDQVRTQTAATLDDVAINVVQTRYAPQAN